MTVLLIFKFVHYYFHFISNILLITQMDWMGAVVVVITL